MFSIFTLPLPRHQFLFPKHSKLPFMEASNARTSTLKALESDVFHFGGLNAPTRNDGKSPAKAVVRKLFVAKKIKWDPEKTPAMLRRALQNNPTISSSVRDAVQKADDKTLNSWASICGGKGNKSKRWTLTGIDCNSTAEEAVRQVFKLRKMKLDSKETPKMIRETFKDNPAISSLVRDAVQKADDKTLNSWAAPFGPKKGIRRTLIPERGGPEDFGLGSPALGILELEGFELGSPAMEIPAREILKLESNVPETPPMEVFAVDTPKLETLEMGSPEMRSSGFESFVMGSPEIVSCENGGPAMKIPALGSDESSFESEAPSWLSQDSLDGLPWYRASDKKYWKDYELL